jgi:hypothetical protein
LGSETFFSKVGKVFGYNDINFDSNPTFSKRYSLKGDDEARIRQLFNMHVQNFFDRQPSVISIEGSGDILIIFRDNKRVKPAEMNRFISDLSDVRTVFARVKLL